MKKLSVTIAQISCDSGHELVGRSALRCEESGEYNHTPGSCRPAVISNSTCLDAKHQTSKPMFNSRFDGFVVPFEPFVPRCNERGEFHEVGKSFLKSKSKSNL